MIRDSLCVIVPVYNAENTLELLADKLQLILNRFATSQIVFVDDGSTDNSRQKLRKIFKNYDNVSVIFLKRNFGQQSALLCGLRECWCNYAAIIDDDLEQDPADIPALYDELHRGHDVIYGIGAVGRGAFRGLGSKLRDCLFDCITEKPKGIQVSSFRIMSRSVVDYVIKANTKFVYISLEILKHTNCIGNFPVKTGDRAPSGYRPLKLIRLLIHMTVYYAPCRLFKLFRRYGGCYEIGEALRREINT